MPVLYSQDKCLSRCLKTKMVKKSITRTTTWWLHTSAQHAVGGQSAQCGLQERVVGVCGSVLPACMPRGGIPDQRDPSGTHGLGRVGLVFQK